jgi:hypothetical protein
MKQRDPVRMVPASRAAAAASGTARPPVQLGLRQWQFCSRCAWAAAARPLGRAPASEQPRGGGGGGGGQQPQPQQWGPVDHHSRRSIDAIARRPAGVDQPGVARLELQRKRSGALLVPNTIPHVSGPRAAHSLAFERTPVCAHFLRARVCRRAQWAGAVVCTWDGSKRCGWRAVQARGRFAYPPLLLRAAQAT